MADNLDRTKSPSKSPSSRRKSNSPRRHKPKAVHDKTNSTSCPPEPVQSLSVALTQAANSSANPSTPTPIPDVIQTFSTPTSISRPTPVLPSTPDRIQCPLVTSVKAINSLHSMKDKTGLILPSVSHRIPASTSASAKFANSTNGRSTTSCKLKVSDPAKRGSPVPGGILNRASSVPGNAEQSNSYLQSTAAVSSSQGKMMSRKRKIVVDEIPKLVPPLAQKPHGRKYPSGEELVVDAVKAMQLPANCDFLPLETQVEEESHESSVPSHVLLSENSVGVSGSTSRTNTAIDKDAPTVLSSEVHETSQTSPSANKGSSASPTTGREISGNTSSDRTSQESNESFYTAPAYTPTKTPDPTAIKTEVCDPEAEYVGLEEPQTISSFLDPTGKVSCSPVEFPVLVSTTPSDEPMECAPTSDLEPVAMEVGLDTVGLDTEESSCYISPLLTPHVLQTEPVAGSTVESNVPHIVSSGSPTSNSTVAIVSTLGSLVPASRISTAAAEWMAQVEMLLVQVVRQPAVTTWASASTGTVLTSTCTVPAMSTSVRLVASTEGSGQVVTESGLQEAGQPGVATAYSRVDSILSSFLESDIARQIAIKTQTSCLEPDSDRPPNKISPYDSSKTLLRRTLFPEMQYVPKTRKITSEMNVSSGLVSKSDETSACQSTHTSDNVTNPSTGSLHPGCDVAENTIEALQQRVFEEAEKFINMPLTIALSGDKMATSPVQRHPPDNDVFGTPPQLASFVGKLGIYSPTHPNWPESPSFSVSYVYTILMIPAVCGMKTAESVVFVHIRMEICVDCIVLA